MKNILRIAIAASICQVSLPSMAAVPQSGLWSFSGEKPGEPGRGLQIERQNGDVMVISYYGYRADGTSNFYLGSGKVMDGKTLETNLNEYKGGTVLGGKQRTGQLDKIVGRIRIDFDTDVSGVVYLPGEDPQAITKYVYDDHRSRLNNNFKITAFNLKNAVDFSESMEFQMKVDGDRFYMKNGDEKSWCEYTGNLKPKGSKFTSMGFQSCGPNTTSAYKYYKAEDMEVDEKGVLSMKFKQNLFAIPDEKLDMSDSFAVFGFCVPQTADDIQAGRCLLDRKKD
ncbi:hypothetical protein [Diaphorobacter aerolatus]|uniref:Uncharacterized protein n=1 Tax=Diaphorobacter aerolatus TaxID=1288495 RepID=A0A7H0GLY6_9BURK|nr:hypothetical protein [Diaphorobacter aerolatus]QNP49302.1 hypothetical protein H9K75_04350 [Diaphorobacter aerolatus]